MELCLGTVQFGMNYGIRGQRQPSLKEAIEMLDYATQNGIDHIDTANAYGTAEDVVGEFLQKKTTDRDNLFIISKFGPNLLDHAPEDQYYDIMKENLEESLERLHTDYLNCYLLHSARYIWNDAIIDALNRLKVEGYVRNVGVSVYEPDEAKKCIERVNIDFMQLPYSIFDQRMKTEGVFDIAQKEKKKTEIHSRSAFIQGLILMTENEVPEYLSQAKPIVKKIDEICTNQGLSRISLAMNYVKQQNEISHLVFGVDNKDQLRENIEVFKQDLPVDVVAEIAQEFTNLQANIVMPSLWKR